MFLLTTTLMSSLARGLLGKRLNILQFYKTARTFYSALLKAWILQIFYLRCHLESF